MAGRRAQHRGFLQNRLFDYLPRRVFEARKTQEVPGPQAFLQKASALPPKADICSALAYVCFGPEADMVGLPNAVR
jgi:hypothetical protein